MSTKFMVSIINDDLTEADVYMALENHIDELIANGEVGSEIKIEVNSMD